MVNHSILLVGDNPDDADLALPAFKEGGIGGKALVARDGQEAVCYPLHDGPLGGSRAGYLPKVVLLNILPRVDGFEVLRCLRAGPRVHCLSVAIQSSSREERDLGRPYRLGANSSYIQNHPIFPTSSNRCRKWANTGRLSTFCPRLAGFDQG